jgi:YebC/PmpR family DNA-binding regulatory protein
VARLISVAVREGGANPETNAKLRFAIETARSYNLPKENVENAIKKASGEIEEGRLEEVVYEAYGPAGVALIVEGITDNKNRALNEIKQILNQHRGKLVGEGAIKWMFERKGCITIDLKSQMPNVKTKEELELLAIESGAEDLYWHNDYLDVYARIEDLEKVKKNLGEKGIIIDSVSLDWKPKEMVDLAEKERGACSKLFEVLDESETVQEIYSNLKI